MYASCYFNNNNNIIIILKTCCMDLYIYCFKCEYLRSIQLWELCFSFFHNSICLHFRIHYMPNFIRNVSFALLSWSVHLIHPSFHILCCVWGCTSCFVEMTLLLVWWARNLVGWNSWFLQSSTNMCPTSTHFGSIRVYLAVLPKSLYDMCHINSHCSKQFTQGCTHDKGLLISNRWLYLLDAPLHYLMGSISSCCEQKIITVGSCIPYFNIVNDWT